MSSVVTSECNSTPQLCDMLTQGVLLDMGGFEANHDIRHKLPSATERKKHVANCKLLGRFQTAAQTQSYFHIPTL